MSKKLRLTCANVVNLHDGRDIEVARAAARLCARALTPELRKRDILKIAKKMAKTAERNRDKETPECTDVWIVLDALADEVKRSRGITEGVTDMSGLSP